MENDLEAFLSPYECYCKKEPVNDTEKVGHLIIALDSKVYAITDRDLASEKIITRLNGI